MGLVALAHKAKFLLNENSGTILTGMGVAGTLSTAYLTGRASFKAARLIESKAPTYVVDPETSELVFKTEKDEQPGWKPEEDRFSLSKTETVKLVWRLYLPAFGTGIITVTAIIMANRIDSKKIAALTVASGISERAFQEYKAKVVERLGERQHTKLRDEIAQDQVNARPPRHNEVIIAGAGEVLCLDQLTGRYFYSTVEEIRKAENKLNHDILNYDGASLAEFQDMIGLESTPYTQLVGWNTDNLVEVQFSTTMTQDEKPCLVVGFNHPPIPAYTRMR